MLRDKFQDVGEVKFAEMRGTDMGMVRFASEWDAERAVCILSNSLLIILIMLVCECVSMNSKVRSAVRFSLMIYV